MPADGAAGMAAGAWAEGESLEALSRDGRRDLPAGGLAGPGRGRLSARRGDLVAETLDAAKHRGAVDQNELLRERARAADSAAL